MLIGLVLIVIPTDAHFHFSFIYQRSNQQLVLTVTTPPLGNDSFAMDHAPAQGFEGASVVVAHRKSCANGNANQLWRFDSISGFIEAIAADTMNKGTPFKPWQFEGDISDNNKVYPNTVFFFFLSL